MRYSPAISFAIASIIFYLALNFVSGGQVLSDAVTATVFFAAMYLGISSAACTWHFRDRAFAPWREALSKLHITERGWGMPLQLWVQAARQELRVKEIAVPRLYLDPTRAFGGVMNDPEQRLAYYRGVLAAAERDVLPEVRAASYCPCAGPC